MPKPIHVGFSNKFFLKDKELEDYESLVQSGLIKPEALWSKMGEFIISKFDDFLDKDKIHRLRHELNGLYEDSIVIVNRVQFAYRIVENEKPVLPQTSLTWETDLSVCIAIRAEYTLISVAYSGKRIQLNRSDYDNISSYTEGIVNTLKETIKTVEAQHPFSL